MGPSKIVRQPHRVWLPGHQFVKLHDLGRWELIIIIITIIIFNQEAPPTNGGFQGGPGLIISDRVCPLVPNCHSTIHIKQANLSMMEYCRSFGQTMKESIKRITQWAAYYHTSRRSWYPKPEETFSFSQMPIMEPLPVVEMPQANVDLLRDWASSYGAAVRQRTVHRGTTMAMHGTLPEYMNQRQCAV